MTLYSQNDFIMWKDMVTMKKVWKGHYHVVKTVKCQTRISDRRKVI